MFSRFKKPPMVPDKGQRIRLLTDNGKWIGGYRAASYPVTSEDGEGAIWVAEETEFWEARFEERLAEARRAAAEIDGSSVPQTTSELAARATAALLPASSLLRRPS